MLDLKVLEEKLWLVVRQLEDYFNSDDDYFFFVPARFSKEEVEYLNEKPNAFPEVSQYAREMVFKEAMSEVRAMSELLDNGPVFLECEE